MKQINYNHLHYFYIVAKEGSIAKASEKLNISPQSISRQISVMEDYLGVSLFDRVGKRLDLNSTGRIALSYAEDIFGLGTELAGVLASEHQGHRMSFTVGIIDVIPKVFAFDLLKQTYNLGSDLRLISREGDFDYLLAELALNKLDLIISDRPLPTSVSVKAYSHFLGESGFTFFAQQGLAQLVNGNFPQSLHACPFLLPSDRSVQRNNILSWFERKNIQPFVVGEFDDTALMKFFGQDGLGVFCAPSGIEKFLLAQFDVEVVGRTNEIKERYYGISPERKIKHNAVEVVFKEARRVMSNPKE